MNLFNIAYVRYWFLYKSFNTKSLFKKSRREPGHRVSEAKVYEFHFFSVRFCTGTPSFPCFDVLAEAKSGSPRESAERVSEGFCKRVFIRVWRRDLQGHCPHLCASRLFCTCPWRYYPYVWRRAIFPSLTSLAHDWSNQLLGATAGVDLMTTERRKKRKSRDSEIRQKKGWL